MTTTVAVRGVVYDRTPLANAIAANIAAGIGHIEIPEGVFDLPWDAGVSITQDFIVAGRSKWSTVLKTPATPPLVESYPISVGQRHVTFRDLHIQGPDDSGHVDGTSGDLAVRTAGIYHLGANEQRDGSLTLERVRVSGDFYYGTLTTGQTHADYAHRTVIGEDCDIEAWAIGVGVFGQNNKALTICRRAFIHDCGITTGDPANDNGLYGHLVYLHPTIALDVQPGARFDNCPRHGLHTFGSNDSRPKLWRVHGAWFGPGLENAGITSPYTDDADIAGNTILSANGFYLRAGARLRGNEYQGDGTGAAINYSGEAINGKTITSEGEHFGNTQAIVGGAGTLWRFDSDEWIMSTASVGINGASASATPIVDADRCHFEWLPTFSTANGPMVLNGGVGRIVRSTGRGTWAKNARVSGSAVATTDIVEPGTGVVINP